MRLVNDAASSGMQRSPVVSHGGPLIVLGTSVALFDTTWKLLYLVPRYLALCRSAVGRVWPTFTQVKLLNVQLHVD